MEIQQFYGRVIAITYINQPGTVLAFEEINKLSRDILIKKDIVQQLGYELVCADTDSVFIKKKDCTPTILTQILQFCKQIWFQGRKLQSNLWKQD